MFNFRYCSATPETFAGRVVRSDKIRDTNRPDSRRDSASVAEFGYRLREPKKVAPWLAAPQCVQPRTSTWSVRHNENNPPKMFGAVSSAHRRKRGCLPWELPTVHSQHPACISQPEVMLNLWELSFPYGGDEKTKIYDVTICRQWSSAHAPTRVGCNRAALVWCISRLFSSLHPWALRRLEDFVLEFEHKGICNALHSWWKCLPTSWLRRDLVTFLCMASTHHSTANYIFNGVHVVCIRRYTR